VGDRIDANKEIHAFMFTIPKKRNTIDVSLGVKYTKELFPVLGDMSKIPYEWVTFKNVSLRPNFKTDVQIRTGEQVNSGAGERKEDAGQGEVEKKNGLTGKVLDFDGKAAEGAEISCATGKVGVTLVNGSLKPRSYIGAKNSKIVISDSNGGFDYGDRPDGIL